MAQPDYVPIRRADRVRPTEAMPVPRPWRPQRPADLAGPEMPKGRHFGKTGPDLGYGLKLAHRFEERLVLTEGEHREDAVAGCFAVGSRRAATLGRAPVIYDMEFAYTVWGFLGGAPGDLVSFRKPLFQGGARDYWAQREIADRVREDALYLSPAEVDDRLSSWRDLIDSR
jgi:hypothetical protein